MRTTFIALLLLALTLPAGATRIADSLAALAAKPDPGDHFGFVVMADSHTGLDPKDTAGLRATMREISYLHPELVMVCGDLIKGQGTEANRQEWANSIADLSLAGAPIFPAIGNHDVAGPEMAVLWEEINGPQRYSFDRGNCHFIVLNTMENGGVQSPASIAWLKADLAATKAKHILVFQHDPVWVGDPAKWRPVHDILKGYPVRMVFAGHWHNYMKFDLVDGIQYVVAPASTERPPLDKVTADMVTSGHFGGYLLVQVQGDQVSYAPVLAGGVLSPDVSLFRVREERARLQQEAVQLPVVDFTYGKAVAAELRVRMTNPSDYSQSGKLTWQVPAGWQLKPASQPYQVPAKGSKVLTFTLQAAAASARYPTPEYATQYLYGEEKQPLPIKGRLQLRPLFAVPKAKQVVVDGSLADWQGVPAMPFAYAERIPVTDVANLSGQAQWQWDEQHLYLAVKVRDNVFYQPYTGDGVWQADALEMTFDPANNGNAGAARDDDRDFSFAKTPKGLQAWVARSPEGYEGPTSDIQLAIERVNGHTIYEAAFPLKALGLGKLAAGDHIGYNLAVQDLDGTDPTKRHWWIELLPGQGGGGRPPLVNLVMR